MAAQSNKRRSFVRALLTLGLCFLFSPPAALAWGYQGHRVVGSIATELLNDNAAVNGRNSLRRHRSRRVAGARGGSPSGAGDHMDEGEGAGGWLSLLWRQGFMQLLETRDLTN